MASFLKNTEVENLTVKCKRRWERTDVGSKSIKAFYKYFYTRTVCLDNEWIYSLN